MYNILIKDVAHIVYDKMNSVFLVRYETENLNEQQLVKIIRVYRQLVKRPTVFINDVRSFSSFNREVNKFILNKLQELDLKAVLFVINNTISKKLLSILTGLGVGFKNFQDYKVLTSLQDALDYARAR